jgi:hypothetical protein
MGNSMTHMTFDEMVKRQKAVEWLLANDAIVRAAAEHAKTSLVAAILIGAEHGEYFASKIGEVAKRMEVTEQERLEGYPLPKDDAERLKRAKVRMNAGLSR